MLGYTHEFFAEVSALCHNDHDHEPWGQLADGSWATAAEVHYPLGLCKVVANVVCRILQASQVDFSGMDQLHDFQLATTLGQQLQSGKQSKRGAGPWTPNYKSVVHVFGPVAHAPHLQGSSLLLPEAWHLHSEFVSTPHVASIPAGSRILHCYRCKGGEGSNANSELHGLGVAGSGPDITALRFMPDADPGKEFLRASFGIHWTPQDFVSAALKRGHPKDAVSALPSRLKSAVDAHVNGNPLDISRARLHWAQKWTSRAVQLRADEEHLKSTLDPEVASIVSNKRILLFEELLKEMDYEDSEVGQLLRQGVPLVGEVQRSHVFPAQFKPAVMSVACLRQMSAAINATIVSQTASSASEDTAEPLWRACLEEVRKGWLAQPEPASAFPKSTVVSRRFAIMQKEKMRMIDDMSQSQLNATVTSFEKPVMLAVDSIASLLVTWLTEARNSWCEGDLQGKSFDLKSAYKQMAVAAGSKEWSLLAVWNTDLREVAFFRSRVAPFGSIQSVFCFLRLSMALWAIGCSQLNLAWTVFYDDFLLFSPTALTTSSDQAATMLFDLTGWVYAREGSKNTVFAKEVAGLGIQILLSEMSLGRACLANTPARKEEILSELRTILSEGRLTSAKALQLHGRMHFAMAQLYGRSGKVAVKQLIKHAYDSTGVTLKATLRDALSELVWHMETGSPRELTRGSSETFLVFTDASQAGEMDDSSLGVGGVVLDNSGNYVAFFSERVPDFVLAGLGWRRDKRIIFGCEMLAVTLAFWIWKAHLSQKQCVIYVDNEGVKFALIKGSSAAEYTGDLLSFTCFLESDAACLAWYARVPTSSNISDAPSRGDTSFVDGMGCKRVAVDWEAFLDEFGAHVKRRGHERAPTPVA